jgi:hypothetical protein
MTFNEFGSSVDIAPSPFFVISTSLPAFDINAS